MSLKIANKKERKKAGKEDKPRQVSEQRRAMSFVAFGKWFQLCELHLLNVQNESESH